MSRATKHIPAQLLMISAVATALLLSACGTVPTTGKVTLAEGAVSYSLAGQSQGLPTVVFQSGLGNDKSAWSQVLPTIQKGNRVFAYDRPGYGGSPAVAGMRDACSIAAEQRRVLHAAGVRPPYVLVGHSLGGLYQYVFAKMYPDEVAGVVLLDPTHPQQWKTVAREAPKMAAVLKRLGGALLNSTAQREFDEQAVCLDAIDTTRSLRVPAHVLVSTKHNPLLSSSFIDMVDSLFLDWARMTGANGIESVAGSGHHIQKERPQAVIAAIESVFAQVRKNPSR